MDGQEKVVLCGSCCAMHFTKKEKNIKAQVLDETIFKETRGRD